MDNESNSLTSMYEIIRDGLPCAQNHAIKLWEKMMNKKIILFTIYFYIAEMEKSFQSLNFLI